MPRPPFADHSARSLAWLGDVELEREVRRRLVACGGYATGHLDRARTALVRAERQAQFLEAISDRLDEDEQALVRRAKNTRPPSTGRRAIDVKTYRLATAFEALVGAWSVTGDAGARRFSELVAPLLDDAVEQTMNPTPKPSVDPGEGH